MFTRRISLYPAIVFLALIKGCGGGGSTLSAGASVQLTADTNTAWEKARVYMPHSSQPVGIGELKGARPSAVAIYLHGCDGVSNTNDKLYHPIWLASLGYLVVMPDSYFGQTPGSPNSLLCSQDPSIPAHLRVNPAAEKYIPQRIKDAEYAVSRIQAEPAFDGKNLLVFGHSQGAYVLWHYPNVRGATKVVWSAYGGCPANVWLQSTPKLWILSANDPWFPGFPAGMCQSFANWILEILPGSEHDPIRTEAGYKRIFEFVKIN